MKKLMPVLVLVTIICIVVGTYIHVGGAFKGGFKWSDLPSIHLGPSLKEEAASFSESYKDVEELEIDMSFGNVTVVEGKELNVSYEGVKDLEPEVVLDDDKLTVKQKKNVRLKGIDLGKYKSELTVAVPSSEELKKISADLDMGDLKISGACCKELDADLDMGNLEIKDVKAGKIEADNDMGDCKVTDSEFDKLITDCNMGNITVSLNDSPDNYGIDANCDMGNISISGKNEGKSYKSTGSKDIKIDVDMGNIEIS